jgi:hypothetical protein
MMIKKSCLIFIIITMVISPLLSEKAERIKIYMTKNMAHYNGMDIEAAKAAHKRSLKDRNRKADLHNMAEISHISAAEKLGISDVNISGHLPSYQAKSDYLGNYMLVGMCVNSGTTSAVFVTVNIKMYDSKDNVLDTDYTYVSGGRNVKLSSSGIYTNALYTNEFGYFKIYTNISYSQVSYIDYWFEWDTYSNTEANAKVYLSDGPHKSSSLGDLKYTGTATNPSSKYLTYFTKVYFCVLNSLRKVEDVDFTYIDGSNYNYGTGTTDTALKPGESGQFTNYFANCSFADAYYYEHAFEWDEVMTGSSLPEKHPPFGQFATPMDNANVSGSVAVTGWALDDSGVDHVKIYRTTGNTDVYIGDALMVEGARPDVAAAYPQYPLNTRAGWGYMMLTNFLPNGGNGTYIIKAIATDIVGKKTTLGTKTIHVDNANAVKPFGAIDTPTQGGTASGSSFVNWGWVLTPMPNSIPTDGSTINVWVDGINLGHPNYNVYRQDIANKFPGYANSNGAIGYFYLDTTAYANGVHTIQWTATDTANNTDGIGSRYFTIQNSGSDLMTSEVRRQKSEDRIDLIKIDIDNTNPVLIQKGFNCDNFEKSVSVDDNGVYKIKIRELEPLKITLVEDSSILACYQLLGNKIRQMPAGMMINKNTINWMPGIAYLGAHSFVVVTKGAEGDLSMIQLSVTIKPKYR